MPGYQASIPSGLRAADIFEAMLNGRPFFEIGHFRGAGVAEQTDEQSSC
jgi:hypothetical protein